MNADLGKEEEETFFIHGFTRRSIAATNQKKEKTLDHECHESRKARDELYESNPRRRGRLSLEHELHKLHEHRLLSVIPAKAGIHLRTTSYEDMFLKITTEIKENAME